MNLIHPAYLFIGSSEATDHSISAFLQLIFCKKKKCSSCIICTQIATKTYSNLLLFEPKNRYVLDDFDIIFKKITFALESDNHIFFYIKHAHLLSAACANALLKIVEEPPSGYHFIFSSPNLESIIPTIRSRCIIHRIQETNTQKNNLHPLAKIFIQTDDSLLFLQTISKSTISDTEVNALLNDLFVHYTNQLKINLISESNISTNNALHSFITTLESMIERSVMPGSGKLLIKELFLKKDLLHIRC